MDASDAELLKATLSAAVPLWIAQIEREHWSWTDVREEAGAAGGIVAHHGDDILYRGAKRDDTARAFNALARGVACLAFVPGGVTVFGLHFQGDAEKLARVEAPED